MNVLKSNLIKIFNYAAAAALFICLLIALLSYKQTEKAVSYIIAALCTAGAIGAFLGLKKLEKHFSDLTLKRFRLISYAMTGVMLMLQVILLFTTDFKIINDLSYIVTGAENFVNGRDMYQGIIEEHKDYFVTYPNNHFLTMIIIVCYKIEMLLFGKVVNVIPIILNIGGMCFSYFLMCRCAEIIHKPSKALICSIRGMMFTPFFTYGPFTYTDTMCLPFGMLAVYTFLKFRENDRLTLLGISGGLLAMAYKIKGSEMVVLAAVLIDLTFTKTDIKKKLARYAVFTVPFFAICKIISEWSLKVLNISKELLDEKVFPFIHWVMMSADGRGGYVMEDFLYTQSFKGEAAKKAADMTRLKEKLSDQGFWGFLEHLGDKIAYTWNNPRFMISYYYNGDYKSPFFKYFSFFLYFTMLLSILGELCISAVKKHGTEGDKPDGSFVPRLCLFGLILFLLVWETRCRYLISLFPIFMLI